MRGRSHTVMCLDQQRALEEVSLLVEIAGPVYRHLIFTRGTLLWGGFALE